MPSDALVIAAHPDDAEVQMAGLSRLASAHVIPLIMRLRGWSVSLATGDRGRPSPVISS